MRGWRAAGIASLIVWALAGCSNTNKPPGPPPNEGGSCTPATCAAQGKNCGTVSDGCGKTLACGSCGGGETCGGGGANLCGKGCVAATCDSLNKSCGPVSDGCGGTLDCGGCASGQSCGANGTPNVCGIAFGGPGPWPIANVTYGAAEGILETPIVGTSTDEAQNLWVATHAAIYVMRPGETRFRRYAAAEGLHLQGNPVGYCDDNFSGGDKSCPIFGAAADPGILEIAGGGPNEVFVGYAGIDDGPGDWTDLNRHSGKLDRVRLKRDGSIQVDRLDLASGNHGAMYWHNRTVSRMLYDHFIHRHELYIGTNHGVDLLRPDLYQPPPVRRGYAGFDWNNTTWMGDHLHARVCYHAPCDDTETNQRMGDWRGLALDANGELWTAGRWTAARIRWDPNLSNWFMRPGSQAFAAAFGDPYPQPPNGYGFINEPVFRPPEEGEPVALTAVTVAPDGKAWFSSGAVHTDDVAYGVASWDGHQFRVYDPMLDLGMAEQSVIDLVALPDGRLVLAGPSSGLVFWNPATGEHKSLRAGQGIADDRVLRLELDTMVSPPALHVSTERGASVIRVMP